VRYCLRRSEPAPLAELAAHMPLVTTVAENVGVVELAASGDYALNPWLRLGAVIGAAPTSGPLNPCCGRCATAPL